LFFKRISDVYDEECAEILAQYGDEEALDFPENHRFYVPKGYHWRDVRSAHENVGVTIINAFRAIERANADKLTGVFGDGAWTNKNRLTDELLKNLIEHFSTLTLSIENCPEDELGQGYEYLIRKFADDSGHTAQEFYTNRTVVHLMTEILKPESGETIYDPTCGSAGMLISAIAYLKTQGKEWRNVRIYGQEINALTSAIARMNLFLHGVKDFEIVNDDTLSNPAFIEHGELMRFDMIVANPPYSISQWNREAFANDKYGRNFLGTPTQGRADYAFFQHILKSLDRKTGRCAILFPHGVLFRNEENALREKLVTSDMVECVIGLGANLFYNSPMEACVIICRTSKRPERRGQILLINAVNDVTRKNAFSYLEDAHIKKIADAYEQYSDIDGFSKVITIADTASNSYSLSIPLYVRDAINGNIVDNRTAAQCAAAWQEAMFDMHLAYADLRSLLATSSRIYTLEQPEPLMVAEETKNVYVSGGLKADQTEGDVNNEV
jgi:type I restriction enzyme M protein